MANDKKFVVKNGLTTQNISFVDDTHTSNNIISLEMTAYDALSFQGNSGQLFTIVDDMSGVIFAVNDVSGVPSIEVEDTGVIRLAEFGGNVLLGFANNVTADKLQINGGLYAEGNIRSLSFASANGTPSIPAYDFTADPNTGMFLAGADTIGFATNGTTAAQITSTGNLRLFNTAGTFYTEVSNQPTSNRILTLPDGNTTLVAGTMVPTTGTGATGTWAISVTGNANTASSLATARSINGTSFNGTTDIFVPRVRTLDIRTVAPSSFTQGYATFGFGSWNNNNTLPFSDFIALRSYTDASGGNDNMISFRKDTLGIRLWQAPYGNNSPFSTFKDVAWTDGTNATGVWNIIASTANNATNLNGQPASFYLDWTNIANKPDPVITLAGDLIGSVTLTDLGSGTLTATIAANSVVLGADTVGNYVASLVQGTGVIIANNTGESATPTISIGQDVSTSSSVQFANLVLSGDLTVNGTTTTINTTNITTKDTLIELNSGANTSTNDSGILINRGSTGANVFMGWNETADKFVFGTTTATGNTTGSISVTPGTVIANTFEGSLNGNATTSTTANNIAGGVAGGVPYQSGVGTTAITAAGTAGQAFVSAGSSAPSWQTLTLENIPDAWVKRSVKAATTANITLSGAQTIDGVSVVAGDRVLVKNQTAAAENGIYVVAAGAWTRAADANISSELAAATVGIDQGTTNGGKTYDTDFKGSDTLGTTAMSWYRVLDAASIGSEVQAYNAGLQSIAGLTTAADRMIYTTAADTYAVTTLTAAGRAILDDADAAAQRTTLGLGTANNVTFATVTATTSLTSPLLSNAGTLSLSATGLNVITASTNGSERLRITDTGRVGIGTTTPTTSLHVTATPPASVPAPGAVSSHMAIGTNPYGTSIGTLSSGRGYIQQQRFDGNTAVYDLLLNPNGGNIGIGTSTPSASLTVGGVAGSDRTLQLGSAGATRAILSTNATDGTVSLGATNDSTTGILRFLTGPSLSERMRIDSNGNVGIGISSPVARLDIVAGDARWRVSHDGVGNIQHEALNSAGTTYSNLIQFANNFIFSTSGTERLRINVSGNLGLGVIPSAWAGSFKVFQVGPRASVYSDATSGTIVGNNIYNDGSNRYIASAAASVFLQEDGAHKWFNAPSGTAGNAISLKQAMILNVSGNLGIGTTNPSTILHANGEITATDFNTTSDLNVKENIEIISDAVVKVSQINGVTFNFKADNTKQRHAGVIAQDVEKVLPEAVKEMSDGIKHVAYGNLIGLLVEAIKDQQKQIDELKALINK